MRYRDGGDAGPTLEAFLAASAAADAPVAPPTPGAGPPSPPIGEDIAAFLRTSSSSQFAEEISHELGAPLRPRTSAAEAARPPAVEVPQRRGGDSAARVPQQGRWASVRQVVLGPEAAR